MKKTFALTATVVFSQAMVLFAGETEISSKNVIQPAPLPPASYFRANEFDLGAFGTYDTTFNQNRRAIGDHAWGGGHEFDLLPLVVCRFWGRLEPSEYHTRSRSCSSGGRKIYSALPAGSDLSESSPRALRLWRGGGSFRAHQREQPS